MNLHVEKRTYFVEKWPVWCLMDGETVLQCFLTEDEALQAMKQRGKPI